MKSQSLKDVRIGWYRIDPRDSRRGQVDLGRLPIRSAAAMKLFECIPAPRPRAYLARCVSNLGRDSVDLCFAKVRYGWPVTVGMELDFWVVNAGGLR